MRKLSLFVMTVFLALTVCCGRSGDSGMGSGTDAQAKSPDARVQADKATPAQPGQEPGSQPQNPEDIDIDKLDIPDQLKEAIKAGRIPKERIPEILARVRERGVQEGEASLVSVEPVRRENLNSFLVLNGIVEPERKIEIFSRLSAYVKKIVKEEGAFVKENEVLALLDDTEIRISYEQANIELTQAKLSLEEAEKNYLRYQELIKRELISEQDFQNQEAEYKQRQLDYQNRLENFKNLQLQLNWTKISSLSEGYITERLIEMGDRVNANQQVFTIEDFNPLLIRVSVPTSDAIKLKIGMPVDVMTDILKGTTFKGKIKLINPRIDAQTGTVRVTVEVFDESLSLKPGMFVEARISIGMKENVIVIPRKAILYKQNKTYAFVLKRNQVSQREILLGLTEEDYVEVTSGLNEGETIVVVGVEGLKDGERVSIVR